MKNNINEPKICKMCGNELEYTDKFCGKCGKKYISKENITNICRLFIVIFVMTFFVSVIIFPISHNNKDNKSKVLNSKNRYDEILSCIDEENKEFYIKGKDLANELIKIKSDSDKIFVTDFEKETMIVENASNQKSNIYSVGYPTLKICQYLIFSDYYNDNIYRIYIFYPAGNYSSYKENCNNLYKALNNIGEKDLANTANKMMSKMDNISEEEYNSLMKDITEDITGWEMNGVCWSCVDYPKKSKYQMSYGMYYILLLK